MWLSFSLRNCPPDSTDVLASAAAGAALAALEAAAGAFRFRAGEGERRITVERGHGRFLLVFAGVYWFLLIVFSVFTFFAWCFLDGG